VAGVNTGDGQIDKLKGLIERTRPDKVHLNTAVRPPAEPEVLAVPAETLEAIARQIGGRCEVIGAPPVGSARHEKHAEADVVSVLKRRPCSVQDICTGLAMDRDEVLRHLSRLQGRGAVTSEPRGDITYFHIRTP
jgi:wyosine [tRNA(Phe)-imidazoG37] synthetase (radical SAM superfamily)